MHQSEVKRLPVPNTEQVQVCVRCHGQGAVRCYGCGGRGHVRVINSLDRFTKI